VVLAAARATPDDLPQLACLAQARCSEAFRHVTGEALQLHGGIGMTEEHDIGLFLKRAKVCQALLGDAAWHRRRWASLRGY
jgi:alkylation response protein AidB-like acyl-CoA dehydrogenase